MSHLPVTSFLRNVLLADAVVSGAVAVLMLAGGRPLQDLLQLPAWLLVGPGAVLMAYALFVGWLSRRSSVPRAIVWTLIVINVGWAFDCALIAFASWLQPSAWGQAFLGVHIVAVLVFARLQYAGLQREPARSAHAHA